MLGAWEVVLERKSYEKRSRRRNYTECKGHPVPISEVVDGVGLIETCPSGKGRA